ncbi:endonuclease domain-containing protein [Sphingomonas daechungensis]|uniref:Endonuclease domain-containing protein n=2 Tax=Sphingomonas daechungensis TaxID=1176646 RepID=A0ABX6T3U4_9SPHN|nr:endonuclease domain-containing protein [Sphingomonas daechungensis]QNP44330.1 endonuclease domain-containing protein [Sphingomonas daechungensis]
MTQIPPEPGGGPCAAWWRGPGLLRAPIKQVKRARRLRRELTLPEVLLWQALRKRPNGLKFRRQFPIGPIAVDFACLDRRLIVEVDGEGNSFGDQPRRDAARDALLVREGFGVLRIPARAVLEDLDAVIRRIVSSADVGPSTSLRPVPSRAGEE